jgi:hypothetical protein
MERKGRVLLYVLRGKKKRSQEEVKIQSQNQSQRE